MRLTGSTMSIGSGWALREPRLLAVHTVVRSCRRGRVFAAHTERGVLGVRGRFGGARPPETMPANQAAAAHRSLSRRTAAVRDQPKRPSFSLFVSPHVVTRSSVRSGKKRRLRPCRILAEGESSVPESVPSWVSRMIRERCDTGWDLFTGLLVPFQRLRSGSMCVCVVRGGPSPSLTSPPP